MYTSAVDNRTLANADGTLDLWELDAAQDKPIKIKGLIIDIASSADVAAGEEEVLRFKVIRGHTTIGSGGTAVTPRPCNVNDAAAGFTSDIDNTTIASAGSGVDIGAFTVPVHLGGREIWLPDDCEWETDDGEGLLVVRLMAAVTDDLEVNSTIWVEEA